MPKEKTFHIDGSTHKPLKKTATDMEFPLNSFARYILKGALYMFGSRGLPETLQVKVVSLLPNPEDAPILYAELLHHHLATRGMNDLLPHIEVVRQALEESKEVER